MNNNSQERNANDPKTCEKTLYLNKNKKNVNYEVFLNYHINKTSNLNYMSYWRGYGETVTLTHC